MITEQTQVKINLPLALFDYAQSEASRFGITIASYFKHLLLKEVEKKEYPVFKASKRTEMAYQKAMKDYKAGKTIEVKDINDL